MTNARARRVLPVSSFVIRASSLIRHSGFVIRVSPQRKRAPMPKTYSAPPAMSIDPAKKYTVVIDTNRGKITLDLFPKDAPKTVNNFVFLAREGFYNGVKFHRVIPD